MCLLTDAQKEDFIGITTELSAFVISNPTLSLNLNLRITAIELIYRSNLIESVSIDGIALARDFSEMIAEVASK